MQVRFFAIVFVLFSLAVPMHGQTLQQAQDFVNGLYNNYKDSKDFSPLAKPAQFFAPSLLRLIQKDAANAKGEVGALDFDPICACQDSDGLEVTKVVAHLFGGPNRAMAGVYLEFHGGRPNEVLLKLLWTPAGWRIEDIQTPTTPSLAKLLTPAAAPKRH